jgi:VCBS repeat-containing protein
VAITDQLNATDADGDSLTYAVSTGPMFGTLSLSSDGAFTYTPDGEYTGTDSFSYTVSDGTAFAVTGFIDITVEVLEVSFNDTVRTVFTLDANAEPVSVNGRDYIEDANSPGNFDDLLDN